MVRILLCRAEELVLFQFCQFVNDMWLIGFCLVGYPLTVIGGILGKNWANGFDAPCRTKNIAREIPSMPWYRSPLAHCVVGGFLPFRSDLFALLVLD